MKKLTAGIFATLLAVVSADSAYAAIASKGYVDEKVGTVTTALGNKADKTAIADMLTKTEAGTTYATKESIADMETKSNASATYATKSEVSSLSSKAEKIANRVTTVSDASDNTHYPTAKAVWDVVQAETSGIASSSDLSALTTRVTTAEGEIDTLQTDMAGKANTDDLGTLATLSAVGSAQITDGAVATADIASKAVTKEKLADDIVTSLGRADTALQQASLNGYLTKTAADTAYAAKTLEGQVGTVSKENMGTTTATTVVGGVKEAINAAKAAASAASTADGKAVAAQGAAEAAQGDVNALEAVVNHETTGLAAAHTAIDALESGKLDKTATAARATADASGNVITDTYATKAEIADMATDENLELKQDKTDNTLATTNKTVVGAINEVKTTADAALPKTTYNTQVGVVSATNMGTTASTVVAAIKEVADEAADAASAASTADSKAVAAQGAAEAAQETADAAIPKPDGECSNPTNKCVLTFNNSAYAWEVIERGVDGE